ncbi:MAG: hypothetical protein ACI85K_000323, partial [Hyphomicrobiaceae bacterium]
KLQHTAAMLALRSGERALPSRSFPVLVITELGALT